MKTFSFLILFLVFISCNNGNNEANMLQRQNDSLKAIITLQTKTDSLKAIQTNSDKQDERSERIFDSLIDIQQRTQKTGDTAIERPVALPMNKYFEIIKHRGSYLVDFVDSMNYLRKKEIKNGVFEGEFEVLNKSKYDFAFIPHNDIKEHDKVISYFLKNLLAIEIIYKYHYVMSDDKGTRNDTVTSVYSTLNHDDYEMNSNTTAFDWKSDSVLHIYFKVGKNDNRDYKQNMDKITLIIYVNAKSISGDNMVNGIIGIYNILPLWEKAQTEFNNK